MDEYHEARDFPGKDGTSTMSPYLAVGAISSKQCLRAAMSESPTPWPDVMGLKDGRAGWINELIWREFYRHLLIAFPKLCMYQPFQAHTKAIEWSDRDEEFEAWTQAQTGYPIVDAALRQLLETGWMHNRLRMVVAMFLTKNLLQDWRKGERFFMNHLIDGDLASNNGGWQWAASTGTDAAPYFRVFNPWSQSAKFDPDGTFIKHYLPELQDVPAKALHDPKRLLKPKPASYPDPICDHKSTRLHAIEVFKNLTK
jgi:deoxyribodipyrimidine photo-lyase